MTTGSMDLTRENLASALASLYKFNLGDFVIDFSTERHLGSSFLDLSIVRSSGQFIQ